MHKEAAEKIAQHYYDLGIKLAFAKHANVVRDFSKAHNAFLAMLAGGGTAQSTTPYARELLSKIGPLSEALSKGDLRSKILDHTYNLDKMDLRGIDKLIGVNTDTVTRAGAEKAVAKLTQALEEAGGLSTTEEVINALPKALGLGAGLGAGTAVFKGLNKLDKKMKLY